MGAMVVIRLVQMNSEIDRSQQTRLIIPSIAKRTLKSYVSMHLQHV